MPLAAVRFKCRLCVQVNFIIDACTNRGLLNILDSYLDLQQCDWCAELYECFKQRFPNPLLKIGLVQPDKEGLDNQGELYLMCLIVPSGIKTFLQKG